MQNSRQNASEILCQHCGKKIVASNYLIHEARCLMMSSRARKEQPSKQQKSQESNYGRREKIEQSRPYTSYRRQSEAERKKIFNNQNKREEEERFPCTYCGYMQSLIELDTHPNECPFSGKPCTYCGQSFPESLMDQHQQACSARVPPHHGNHIHEQEGSHHLQEDYGPESDEDEEHSYSYHPYGNFNYFYGGNQFASSRQPMFRRIQNVNGNLIIQESNGRGGTIRRQIHSNGQGPTFRQLGREDVFGSRRSGPFGDFFRLLQMMALRGEAEQGLTKEQLKKLAKIKYKASSASGEKDLCTICYCEFEQDERIIQLKCKHMYHEECIIKWLEKNAKCPVCKAPQTNRPIHREE